MFSFFKNKFGNKLNLPNHGLSFTLMVSLSFIALQIPFHHVMGSDGSFTLFDLMAPTFGALFGTTIGMVSVLFVNLLNLILKGQYTLMAVIRLFPILFAILYFSKRNRYVSLIGIVCMVLFNLHPVGRQAWQYSLYWLIPALVALLRVQNVFTRAMGATFSQHAVGSVAFLYAYGYTGEFWQGLIPVVAGERLTMGLGIAVTYVAMKAFAKLAEGRIRVLKPVKAKVK